MPEFPHLLTRKTDLHSTRGVLDAVAGSGEWLVLTVYTFHYLGLSQITQLTGETLS